VYLNKQSMHLIRVQMRKGDKIASPGVVRRKLVIFLHCTYTEKKI
jgi:hypothetical protein